MRYVEVSADVIHQSFCQLVSHLSLPTSSVTFLLGSNFKSCMNEID